MVPAVVSGYIQNYSDATLVRIAQAHDITISLIHPIGHYVVTTRPLAKVWQTNEDSPPRDLEPAFAEIRKAIRTESERFEDRDVGFGIRQLVDIAIRSVAPSLNDPYTAVQTIQPLSALMVEIAGRDLSDRLLHDHAGVLRVFEPITSFESHLALACGHIRHAASNRPRVVTALMRLLEDVSGNCTDDSQRAEVREQVELLLEEATRDIAQPADLVGIQVIA